MKVPAITHPTLLAEPITERGDQIVNGTTDKLKDQPSQLDIVPHWSTSYLCKQDFNIYESEKINFIRTAKSLPLQNISPLRFSREKMIKPRLYSQPSLKSRRSTGTAPVRGFMVESMALLWMPIP
jgi:hypothetical protein